MEPRKNISADMSWLDRDIKRWKEIGTLVPTMQLQFYKALRDISCGLTVIDIGCSIGVGSNVISHQARHVWGVDINTESIKFANDTFARPNLSFEVYDVENPGPREHAKFDLVVMSEVIEHVEDPDKALQTMKTFFHDKSVGYITTPNKNNPNLSQEDLPHNELHLKEWRAGEFYEYLTKHFQHVTLFSIPKLKQWNPEETIDGDSEETPIVAKVERPIL